MCILPPAIAADASKTDYGWLLKLQGKEYFDPAHEKQLKAVFTHIMPQAKLSLYNGPAAKQMYLEEWKAWSSMNDSERSCSNSWMADSESF